MIIAGMAMPAISAMPTGAPTSVPNCHRIFFFLLQGFLPQNVHPEGLFQEHKNQLNPKCNLCNRNTLLANQKFPRVFLTLTAC